LQNGGLLTLRQGCQQHDLAIWKLQCIVMRRYPFFIGLSKDRCPMGSHFIAPGKQASR